MNYHQIYHKIIENRRLCKPDGYTESHHIIPRSLGGTDNEDNLVDLTAREHYICHLLLTKMYDYGSVEYYKMLNAYMMMCNAKSYNREYNVNSRLYEQYRIEYSKMVSMRQLGDGNSQHGTIWISNFSTKQCMKIGKSSVIPDGWVKGRVVDWDNHYSQKHCIVCGAKGLSGIKSKTCSKVCALEYSRLIKLNNATFSTKENRDMFAHYYIETKSIRQSIILLGKVCGGGYIHTALRWINEDPVLLDIYNSNKEL